MESDLTWQEKKLEREIEEDVNATDRFVDVGVILKTVVADPDGEELIPGKPKLRVVRERELGCIIDTRAVPPQRHARTANPRVWYCSVEQEPIILHADDEPLGQLVYGSEGAGKSTAIAMWLYCRWIEHIGEGREGGLTAPTKRRLKMVRRELLKLFDETWFSYSKSEQLFSFCDGTTLQLVSTHRQSAAGGSPLQGYNWSWCARDELQDQLEVADDIVMRGRDAGGDDAAYKQLASATAKDASDWRNYRDKILQSGDFHKRVLLGTRSPFVAAAHWERVKRLMSPREYLRRVLAMDVPVELAVYYGWDRERNLRAISSMATDVTAAVVGAYGYQSYLRQGARFTLVGCHDPGNIFNTTELVRLVVLGGIPTWVAVGELQTKQTTARQHARELKTYVQDTFQLEHKESSKVAIFVDPHGKGEAATDYQTVYMAMQREGLDVFSPAPISGRIKRSSRVAMLNRMMFAADGNVRFVVAKDAQGLPVSPVLVDAFESLQKKPGDDDPEGSQRKDADDKTHAPAGLSYGMWPFEQEAFVDRTIELALAEARRVRL